MKTKTFEEQIQEILIHFDWEKVVLAMNSIQWTWHEIGIPDRGQLADEAIKLLKMVSSEEFYIAECGGLRAENNRGCLSLKFVLERWDCEQSET